MSTDEQAAIENGFSSFVVEHEPRLRRALTAAVGWDLARDATAEALAYGWEHWDRVSGMTNPAGYLYRVGLNWGRKQATARPDRLPGREVSGEPWFEPELPEALAGLSEQQRVVTMLVHGHEWSLGEVAHLLGISKGTVQRHLERAMSRLQRTLGVDS